MANLGYEHVEQHFMRFFNSVNVNAAPKNVCPKMIRYMDRDLFAVQIELHHLY
jgi:hypothetical protein